ncbi:MAG TPA: hypothetical protein VK590_11995 [Saprospiraceae bacterium]|nr:hypothetical protein [Saprospiraceae bacterium]
MLQLIKDKEQVLITLERISNVPLKKYSHLFGRYGGIKIIDAVNKWTRANQGQKYQPAIIFLRVVLAANRKYRTHVEPHIDRIIKENSSLSSFESLRKIINAKTRDEFYQFWGHKDFKKYSTLINLLKAVEQVRLKYQISDDYMLMKRWAEEIDIIDYKNDIIGRINNVAIATIQHLRMDFGINTVKPDQRVIEVLEKEFGFDKITQLRAINLVEEISFISNIKVRELDLILVNYGSGYYANRNLNSEQKIRIEIADKLSKHGINDEIIYVCTGIKHDRAIKN